MNQRTANASKWVLETRDLNKRFGGITATQNVNLHIAAGARHALIGPNGAGKTTLINLMTGVLPATSGQVFLNGEDITHLPAYQRTRRGMVRTFQINQLFTGLTPAQTLLTVATEHAKNTAEASQSLIKRMALSLRHVFAPLGANAALNVKVERILTQCKLSEVAHLKTELLPYGKRRQLEIAIALACEPTVLLLDEPVAGVPPGERDELLQTLAALPAEVSMVLIEHDMALVFEFAKRMTVLVNGAVLTEGSPQDIANDPQVKAVYLGHSMDGTDFDNSHSAAHHGVSQ
jgi:branched-chain amino acid transport system ATP-binding protein